MLCVTVLFGSFYFYSHGTVDGMTWACVVLLHTQNLDPLQTQFQFRYIRVRTFKSEDSFRSVLGPSFKQRLQGSPFFWCFLSHIIVLYTGYNRMQYMYARTRATVSSGTAQFQHRKQPNKPIPFGPHLAQTEKTTSK